MLHPRFLVDCCNSRVSCRTLRLCIIYEFYNKMYDIVDKCHCCEYWLFMNLEYVVKLLTFVNRNFCSEMLATRLLVQIDVVKEKTLNREF